MTNYGEGALINVQFTVAKIIFLSTPLFYVSLSGVRLIVVGSVLLAVLVVYKSKSFVVRSDLIIYAVLLCYMAVMSLASYSFEVFFAAVLFFILLYWPCTTLSRVDRRFEIFRFFGFYTLGAMICSLGVLVQLILFNYFGMETGKIDFYYQRTGFGFLWRDYSFLSLYLASAIPLVAFFKSGFLKVVVVCFLLAGAIATSARTGVFALLVAFLLFSMGGIAKSFFLTGKLNVKTVALLVIGFLAVASIPMLWGEVSDRELTLSGSGRISGLYNALDVLISSPLFGMKYNTMAFSEVYGTVPHNVFAYMYALGGGVGGTLFAAWLFLFSFRLMNVPIPLKVSFITVLIGVQLIPSFFSAYFIALLFSIVIFGFMGKGDEKRNFTA